MLQKACSKQASRKKLNVQNAICNIKLNRLYATSYKQCMQNYFQLRKWTILKRLKYIFNNLTLFCKEVHRNRLVISA